MLLGYYYIGNPIEVWVNNKLQKQQKGKEMKKETFERAQRNTILRFLQNTEPYTNP